MSTVTSGNPVTLDAPFALEGQTPPDRVTFTVELPDDTNLTFVTGDPQVTNPSGTDWRCDLGVPTEVGQYRWRAAGYAGSSGDPVQTIYGTVFVIQSAVDPQPSSPDGPMLGPCSTWITGDDVAATVQFSGWGSDPSVFDTAAYEASMALYEISGRQFTGLCQQVVRPCSMNCPCGWSAPSSLGFGQFWWTGTPYGLGAGWWWFNERGDKLGCQPMSRVRLAGYPIRKIDSVYIDGVLMPEFDPDTGARNWRLDEHRWLTRMNAPPVAPSVDGTPQFWPGCQDMSLDSDQPGTFEITYEWGVGPPQLGRDAACELAAQLYLAFNGKNCVLPAGVTKVTRQGIEIERGLLANWADPTKATGLVHLDLFLQAYCEGQRRGRRSAIYSPDLQQFARPISGPIVGS